MVHSPYTFAGWDVAPPPQARVTIPKNQQPVKLFIGQLPRSITEPWLCSMFTRYGSVLNTKILRDARGAATGAGFVTVATLEQAQACVEALHNKVILKPAQHPLQVRIASVCSRNKIFVGSLPPNIQKDDLQCLFGNFGEIKELTVVPPKPNRPASAFVEFVDEKAASSAISVNGSKPFRTCSSPLEVRFADQRVDGVVSHK